MAAAEVAHTLSCNCSRQDATAVTDRLTLLQLDEQCAARTTLSARKTCLLGIRAQFV